MSKDKRINLSQHEGHTPGPWWLCCEDDTLYARWIQADEKSICSDLNEATEVDAQLLAATPEILDALKKAYEIIDALEAFHARELKIVWGLHDSVCEALDKTMSAWYEEKQKTAPE